MKHLILGCLLSFIINQLAAQCNIAISNTDINNIKFEMSRAINPLNKLNIVQERTRSACFNSYQVKELILLLDNDNDKLSFAKKVYERTMDKNNFYEIYDAFIYPSNMFRLNDFIQDFNRSTTTIPLPPASAINYPDVRFYSGSKGCEILTNNIEFQNILNTIRVQTIDIAKYNTAKALINTKCFSIEQLMHICELISNEAYRLDILKTNIERIYDRGNFTYAAQLLTIESYRNDFINYCTSISTPIPPPIIPIDSFSSCRVNETDFTSMLASIEKLSFNNSQVAQIKTIMNTRCFTVNQIKEFIKLLDYESSKLEIAKYGYEKSIDKNNYYSINDVFTYSSSIDELNKYINNR